MSELPVVSVWKRGLEKASHWDLLWNKGELTISRFDYSTISRLRHSFSNHLEFREKPWKYVNRLFGHSTIFDWIFWTLRFVLKSIKTVVGWRLTNMSKACNENHFSICRIMTPSFKSFIRQRFRKTRLSAQERSRHHLQITRKGRRMNSWPRPISFVFPGK